MRYPKGYYMLCALGFLVILAGNVGNPFLPLYAEELGSSEIFIGIIISSFFVSRVFVELPAGYISDRIGYRSPLILGFVVSTLAAVVAALALSPFHLMAARALWGVGSALFFNLSMNVVVSIVGKEDMGDAMGSFQGIEFIGSFMGAPIGGFIAAIFGYRVVFAVSAGILLVTVIGMTVSKELKAVTSRGVVRGGRDRKERRSWKDAIRAMQDDPFGIVCLTGFLRMFSMMGIFSTIAPIYLNSVLGFDVATIGILMGVRSVGMSLSNFLAGRAAKSAGKPFIYVTSLLLLGVTVVTIVFLPSLEIQMIVFFLSGVASGILMPLLPVTIAETVTPSLRGTAIGFYRTFFAIGAVIAPVLLTWIATVWRIEGCFYFTSALLLFNAVLSLTLRGRID